MIAADRDETQVLQLVPKYYYYRIWRSFETVTDVDSGSGFQFCSLLDRAASYSTINECSDVFALPTHSENIS